MRLRINLKPVYLKHSILIAIFLYTSMVCSVFADDYNTTIGDLSARIEELENQLGQRGENPDDANPGAKVSREDLERLKDEIRALRDTQTRSKDLNDLRDELHSLREDIKHLKSEKAGLQSENAPKKSAFSLVDSSKEKPTGKRNPETWNQTPFSSETDEETESVLKLLEQSAPSEEEEDGPPKRKQKKNLEEIREMATKHAEETAPTLKAGNAQAEYNAAMALHNKGAYKEAQSAFNNVIEDFPNDDLVPQAMYWKAESVMKQGNHKGAQILFVNAYKKNHELKKNAKNSKAPDCLLKLGETFALLGKKENACISWKKLETDFSPLTKEMKTELTALKKQYGCKPKPEKASAPKAPISTPKS